MGGNGMHHLLDKLRPLVGLKSWDYCVIWKLSEDQSCIQWFGCCCGGVDDSAQNLGEELLFPVSTLLSCKDVMVMHSWTKCCDLLAQFPSSISLDSGIYAQTMLSSHPRWLNLPDSPNSTSLHETVGTRVLIPVFGGLVEFFLGKQVAEDPQLIEFVMAQCNVPWDQEAMHNTQMNEFHMNDNAMVDYDSKLNTSNGLDLKIQSNLWASPASTSMDNFSLPWEVSLDQTRLSNSPANFFNELGQQFPSTSENRFKNEVGGFEGSTESIVSDRLTTAFNSPMEQIQFPEFVPLHESLMNNNNTSLHPSIDSCVTKQPVSEKDSIKQESGRADSGSDCSDQAEDDDHKGTGRGGKKHQSKNLVAERKRRKKLNDMLYALRALVPKITKMDRASILGDAIEFVKELEKQVKELQNELGEPVDINGDKNTHYNHDKNGISPGSKSEQDESLEGLKTGINGQGTRCSSNGKIAIPAKQAQDLTTPEEKMPQMEPQVEVTKIDEKEFFLKVFCEHKPGGFVRLMEAMNTLGLEITNANVFRVETLVMNVFKVQKRDNEMVQADYLRESLLGVTRNSIGGWSEPFLVPENGSKCGL